MQTELNQLTDDIKKLDKNIAEDGTTERIYKRQKQKKELDEQLQKLILKTTECKSEMEDDLAKLRELEQSYTNLSFDPRANIDKVRVRIASSYSCGQHEFFDL